MPSAVRAIGRMIALGALSGLALVAGPVPGGSGSGPLPAAVAITGSHRDTSHHRPADNYRAAGDDRPASSRPATSHRRVVVSARVLLRGLTVRAETPKGYQRSKFTLWISQGHGCDTRAVVLKDESSTRTTQNRYCTVRSGRWTSQYDGTTTRRAGGLDIHHRVPLDEAWKSGAKRWTTGTRTAYANDLGYAQSLVAVSAHSNRSKGDRDVTGWLPPRSVCRYVTRWIAVKYRWSLTVNRAEASALRSDLSSCGASRSRVTRPARASVHIRA